MKPSEKDPVSLDEKIALIRKKNEMIIKRKQLIEEEIEIAKKHNAMVDVCAPKTFEDDKPTLYSDIIPKSRREDRRRSVPDKISYKPRSINTREDAAWRAERNEIDRERIRRQRADSGWIREWDADKHEPDPEFLKDSLDRHGRPKETSRTRSSHNRSGSVERSEFPQSTRQNQYKSQQNDVSVERSELPATTRQSQFNSKQSDVSMGRSELPVSTLQSQFKSKPSDTSEELCEKPVPRRNQIRGRGRPLVSANNSRIAQNLRRTIIVEPPKREKAPLKKRVSWGSENELIESPRISLEDDDLNNIKVIVNTVDSNARKRSIEITEERGPLVKNMNSFKFDEKTSFNIKDCVAKASLDKSFKNFQTVIDPAPLPKPKGFSSAIVEPKPIIVKSNIPAKLEASVILCDSAAEEPSKEAADDDEEEWEDLSGEDWESVSDDE